MLRQQAVSAARLGAAALPEWGPGAAIGALFRRGKASQAAVAPVDAPVLPPFDFVPPPYTGPPKEEVLALRKKFLNPGAPSEGRRDARRQLRHHLLLLPVSCRGRLGVGAERRWQQQLLPGWPTDTAHCRCWPVAHLLQPPLLQPSSTTSRTQVGCCSAVWRRHLSLRAQPPVPASLQQVPLLLCFRSAPRLPARRRRPCVLLALAALPASAM